MHVQLTVHRGTASVKESGCGDGGARASEAGRKEAGEHEEGQSGGRNERKRAANACAELFMGASAGGTMSLLRCLQAAHEASPQVVCVTLVQFRVVSFDVISSHCSTVARAKNDLIADILALERRENTLVSTTQ